MINTNRLVVHIPGMSKALLMDLAGGLALRDQRVIVEDEKADGNLNADPGTVALITSAGLVAVELIKSLTQIYLERIKEQLPKATPSAPVQVTVHLTMGGKQMATVSDAAQLDQAFKGFPNTYEEIARVRIS